MPSELGPTCLSVPGCKRPRLTYRGYCDEHGPGVPPPAPRGCIAPLRCYCAEHATTVRQLGPLYDINVARLALQQARSRQAGL